MVHRIFLYRNIPAHVRRTLIGTLSGHPENVSAPPKPFPHHDRSFSSEVRPAFISTTARRVRRDPTSTSTVGRANFFFLLCAFEIFARVSPGSLSPSLLPLAPAVLRRSPPSSPGCETLHPRLHGSPSPAEETQEGQQPLERGAEVAEEEAARDLFARTQAFVPGRLHVSQASRAGAMSSMRRIAYSKVSGGLSPRACRQMVSLRTCRLLLRPLVDC